MALPAQFSLLQSELNDFLFAPLGDEENGAPLSVLSALTRLDIDPWIEAARLSNLPKEAVVGALVSLIALFPRERRTAADVRDMANRLAKLLPAPTSWTSAPNAPIVDDQRPRWSAMWLLWLGLSVALVTMAVRGLFP
jgi:hypothetical protein